MSFLITLLMTLAVIAVFIGLYNLYFFIKRKRAAEWISQEELQKIMRTAQVFDVREKEEYNKGHILGARSLPYTIARAHRDYLTAIRKDSPIYLYENKNTVAIYMATLLKKEGYENVFILKDGLSAWTGKVKRK